jgi:hypothetical protein
MTTAFISYRRDDATAYAGRLYDGLRKRYGDEHVFMDVDRIQPGENFAAVIERSVRGADVVLVVIGPRWLAINNDAGRRRLDDPEDFVRQEVKAALDNGRRVIPVLVGGAGMPAEAALPAVLQRLAGVQAVSMSDERWDYDSERLTRSIDGNAAPHTRRHWYWAAAALVLAAIALGAYLALPRATAPPPVSAITLRAGSAVVSADQARAMVVQRNFFHARWNAAGATLSPDLERVVLGTDVVIKDKRHQLMWQQSVSPRTLDHDSARQYVQELNARRYASHDDWRLPTLEEAMSLMGTGAAEDCRLHKLFDRSGPITRTADTTDSGRDWIVYFCDGIASPEVPNFNAQVRAVRSLR